MWVWASSCYWQLLIALCSKKDLQAATNLRMIEQMEMPVLSGKSYLQLVQPDDCSAIFLYICTLQTVVGPEELGQSSPKFISPVKCFSVSHVILFIIIFYFYKYNIACYVTSLCLKGLFINFEYITFISCPNKRNISCKKSISIKQFWLEILEKISCSKSFRVKYILYITVLGRTDFEHPIFSIVLSQSCFNKMDLS